MSIVAQSTWEKSQANVVDACARRNFRSGDREQALDTRADLLPKISAWAASTAAPPHTIQAAQLAALASGTYLDARESIVLFGDSGTGKRSSESQVLTSEADISLF